MLARGGGCGDDGLSHSQKDGPAGRGYKDSGTRGRAFPWGPLEWPVLRFFSSHHTHLIQRIHFQSKSVHARHAADHLEIRQLGSKVGLKGYVMEVLISYLRLTAVLDFQKKKKCINMEPSTGREQPLGGGRYPPPLPGRSADSTQQKPSPWADRCLSHPCPLRGGHWVASVISKYRGGVLGGRLDKQFSSSLLSGPFILENQGP